MRGIIYKYNSPEGKTYIGQTLTEEKKRKYRHKSDAKNRPNTPFARAINKYGWDNFKHELIASNLTEEEAKTIYDLIVQKQKIAVKHYYRGPSTSRITGEMLGYDEYQTVEWRWPGDFAEHYVLKYRVKPTDEFLKYIGYE